MSRLAISAVALALTVLALAAPAYAKERAVTRLDSLPTQWNAGQSYTIGYTIRMDGVEPYRADRTEILATSLDGRIKLVFPGVADDAIGHYKATVLFPSSGTYHWQVTQGSYFPAFDLGTINVLPAMATTTSSAPDAAAASEPIRNALLFAAIVAVIAVALVLARRQRRWIVRPT